ncbi:MAG: hypothetical protein HOP19_28135 [Acidobacteria bacterium]|nr:hypothetical protein [Acidobacteriota bacterium]
MSELLNGAMPVPGAPGPQNSASPLVNNTGLPAALFNPAVNANSAPNVLIESVPVTNGGMNTASLRALNAGDVLVNGKSVKGLTLETPPL